MRGFDYKSAIGIFLDLDMLSLVSHIYELKGKAVQFSDDKTDTYAAMIESAMVNSIESSNRIEGVFTTDKQLKNIALNKAFPKTKSEEEIAGYREALKLIHENHEYIDINVNYILQIHKTLYQYSASFSSGKFKNVDNKIVRYDSDGKGTTIFQPVSAFETEEYLTRICEEYNKNIVYGTEPLLIIFMFILDFLCMHPFLDGNGRISRLLTVLMLEKNGFDIVKVISLEKLIEDNIETYYESLHSSSEGFHEAKNDYVYFVRYMLGIMIGAYDSFLKEAKSIIGTDSRKTSKVADVIRESIKPITKTEILQNIKTKIPINQVTVQRALAELIRDNKITKLGGGRYTKYKWNNTEEEHKYDNG